MATRPSALGGRDRSDWVKNLRATPEVTVELGDEIFEGLARIVQDPDENERARGRPLTLPRVVR